MYCTALFCTVLHSTILYCTVLYGTLLYCSLLCFTLVYNTVLYPTVPYCTLLYSTVLVCRKGNDVFYSTCIVVECCYNELPLLCISSDQFRYHYFHQMDCSSQICHPLRHPHVSNSCSSVTAITIRSIVFNRRALCVSAAITLR